MTGALSGGYSSPSVRALVMNLRFFFLRECISSVAAGVNRRLASRGRALRRRVRFRRNRRRHRGVRALVFVQNKTVGDDSKAGSRGRRFVEQDVAGEAPAFPGPPDRRRMRRPAAQRRIPAGGVLALKESDFRPAPVVSGRHFQAYVFN